MIRFANCKINLGLHVTEKRNDGFHNIQTIFYPIHLKDIVEIISSTNQSFEYSNSGLPVTGSFENNLCYKAYKLVRNLFPDKVPEIKLHLHKTIPIGAGLGGGSANAAATLLLLNEKYSLDISEKHLIEIALELGSDVPFFILNTPCFASGRGEILESINIDLSNYKMLIVNPKIHISTAWAFSKIIPTFPKYSLKEIIHSPIREWKNNLSNDFENSVFEHYPEVRFLKETLYTHGAIYAAMSGSGSTVFGIFDKEIEFNINSNYFLKWI